MTGNVQRKSSWWWRVLIIVTHWILILWAVTALIELFVSHGCSKNYDCSPLEKLIQLALFIAWSILFGWVTSRGWNGRLYDFKGLFSAINDEPTPETHSKATSWVGNLAYLIGGCISPALLSYARCATSDAAFFQLDSLKDWLLNGQCGHGSALDGFYGVLFLPTIIASTAYFNHGNLRKAAKLFFWWSIVASFCGLLSNS